jgi:hypothetical protein
LNRSSRDQSTKDLCNGQVDSTHPEQRANQTHCKSHSWIEETAGHTMPYPSIYSEREAETRADLEKLRGLIPVHMDRVRDLRARKGEKKEKKGADELAQTGDEMVASGVVQTFSKQQKCWAFIPAAMFAEGRAESWR